MALDPELQTRVADLTGASAHPWTPDDAGRIFAAIGLDSPAVEGAPAAIFSVDLTGRVRSWNRAAEELFGWTRDEVLGRPVPFLSRERLGEAIVEFADLLEDRSYEGIEFSTHHRDGHRLHVLASATLVRDEHGTPTAAVTFATDMTAKKESALAIEAAHHKWRHLLMNISDTVTILDAEGRVLESTGEFTDVLGYDTTAWNGQQGFELLHPDDLPAALEAWEALISQPGSEARAVFRMRHEDGHYEIVEFTGVSLLHDPVIRGVVISTRNVTSERRTEALLADEARILELIARDAPLDDTLPGVVRLVEDHSGGVCALLSLARGATHLGVLCPGSAPPELLDLLTTTPVGPTPAGDALDFRRPITIADVRVDPRFAPHAAYFERAGVRSGWSVPVIGTRSEELLALIATVHDEPGEPDEHTREVARVASHLASIAIERDRWQRELYHQARHHQLTGLPNRSLIVENLEAALRRAEADGTTVAVVFVDLDRFKVVNDSLGHAAGDRLLVRFGARLRNLVRPGDFVGHFGADEFVVILEEVDGDDDVHVLAHRIESALDEPFALDEGEIFLSSSIGVSLSEGVGDDAETLLQHADAAMYRAKDLGRDRLEIFDAAMRTRAMEQLRVDRDLRVAVERAELDLYYQPKIDLRDGRIIGAEALLRWHHPEDGLVLPGRFIGVAEETGLIVRIGRWVLERAVAQARSWVDRLPGLDDFLISVNLSARQLGSPGIVDEIAGVLERHRWPAHQLVLELTESILIDDREATLAVLTELKDLGVKLAIDDFGTGFSSLNYLHRFPVDIVKIDRAFVTNLRAGGEGSPVVTAILHMAHALGLRAAAEGVEEAEQLDGLRALDCDLAQGFLFAEALPGEDLEPLLTGRPAW